MKAAFFDTKPYDKTYFDRFKDSYGVEIEYFEARLTPKTAVAAVGFEAAIAFVNDEITSDTVRILADCGVKTLAMRCAGYNNVDLNATAGVLTVCRVPEYSPHSIAEHTAALLLTLVRKTHKAYMRTKEYNFSLNGFTGFDLYGKTAGIVGTGRIGKAFIDICRGFGMKVCAYDAYPSQGYLEYVSLDELCRRSDVISLHCPLNADTYHMINRETLDLMKNGVFIINTSRGALIDSSALIDAIRFGRVGGAGLDVYEEESEYFYEDMSDTVLRNDNLSRLIAMPNVLVTSHQAFLTAEALENIARVTLDSLLRIQSGERPATVISSGKVIRVE